MQIMFRIVIEFFMSEGMGASWGVITPRVISKDDFQGGIVPPEIPIFGSCP